LSINAQNKIKKSVKLIKLLSIVLKNALQVNVKLMNYCLCNKKCRILQSTVDFFVLLAAKLDRLN